MPSWGTAADFSAVPLCQATSGKFFVGAFDTIFRLADAWELFGHFKNPTRHIPTQRRLVGVMEIDVVAEKLTTH